MNDSIKIGRLTEEVDMSTFVFHDKVGMVAKWFPTVIRPRIDVLSIYEVVINVLFY